jgi:hypothetical protein
LNQFEVLNVLGAFSICWARCLLGGFQLGRPRGVRWLSSDHLADPIACQTSAASTPSELRAARGPVLAARMPRANAWGWHRHRGARYPAGRCLEGVEKILTTSTRGQTWPSSIESVDKRDYLRVIVRILWITVALRRLPHIRSRISSRVGIDDRGDVRPERTGLLRPGFPETVAADEPPRDGGRLDGG